MWIYAKQADGTFGIGYYSPGGTAIRVVTTRTTEAEAQALVSYLNGGLSP